MLMVILTLPLIYSVLCVIVFLISYHIDGGKDLSNDPEFYGMIILLSPITVWPGLFCVIKEKGPDLLKPIPSLVSLSMLNIYKRFF